LGDQESEKVDLSPTIKPETTPNQAQIRHCFFIATLALAAATGLDAVRNLGV
jgi:hypothetical protein